MVIENEEIIMSDVPNRITGMEMEWGITVPAPRYSAIGRPLELSLIHI